MKPFIAAFFYLLFSFSSLFACTMTPSVWKTVCTETEEKSPLTAYAVAEAFMQMQKKFDKEMFVSKTEIKPFAIRSIAFGDGNEPLPEEVYNFVKEAAESVFKDFSILPYEQIKQTGQDDLINGSPIAGKYAVDLELRDPRSVSVAMIDLNPQIWLLLRIVKRDEIRVFARVSDDRENLPLFIDEFEVSPTIIINPLLSPVGGYLVVVEKNNSKPLYVDWGSAGEGSEHTLRVNTSFYAPTETPPLDLFKSDLVKKLERERLNSSVFNQLLYAINSGDVDLFTLILDSYADFDINYKNSEGKAIIHFASFAGNLGMVKSLLDKKAADVNLTSLEGNTPLHESLKSEKNSMEICKFLLSNGADSNIKNLKGESALDVAIKLNPSLVKLFKGASE